MSVVDGRKSGAVQVDPVLDLSEGIGPMVGAAACPARNIVSAAARAGTGLRVGVGVSGAAGASTAGVRWSLRSKSAGSVPRATAPRSAALASSGVTTSERNIAPMKPSSAESVFSPASNAATACCTRSNVVDPIIFSRAVLQIRCLSRAHHLTLDWRAGGSSRGPIKLRMYLHDQLYITVAWLRLGSCGFFEICAAQRHAS